VSVAIRWYGFVGSFVAGAGCGVAWRPSPSADLDHAVATLGWISIVQLGAGLAVLVGLIAATTLKHRFDEVLTVVACGAAVAFVVTGAEGLRLDQHLRSMVAWADRPSYASGKKAVYTGVVLRGPDIGPRGSTVELRLIAADGNPIEEVASQTPVPWVARVFFPADAIVDSLPLPGDFVEFYGAVETYPRQMLPGGWDGRGRMLRRGVVFRAVARGPWERVEDSVGDLHGSFVVDPDVWIRRGLSRLRVGFQQRVLTSIGRPESGVVLALVTGNRQFLNEPVEEAFRETGTGHLLAISGIHLAVLAAGFWWIGGSMCRLIPSLTARFGRKRITGVGVLLGLGLYVAAIGAPTSAVRAWLMVTSVVAAHLLYRPGSGLSGLGLAALIIVAWRPGSVADLGFQFSFAATGAILLFLERLPGVLKRVTASPLSREYRLPTWVRHTGQSVGVSLVASLSTWPVTLVHFGTVSLAGVPVNLVVTPLVSVTVFPAVFAGSALTAVSPGAGAPLLWLAGRGMVRLSEYLGSIGHIRFATIVPGVPPPWVTFMICVGVVIFSASRWRRRPVVIGCLLVAGGLTIAEVWHRWPGGEMLIDVLPVGQGESVLMRSPGGEVMLIDAGGSRFGRDPGRSVVVPHLRRHGVGVVDWVVATHADVDHIGGLRAVVERLRPRRIVVDGSEGSRLIRSLADDVRDDGGTVWSITPGTRMEFHVGGVSVEIARAAPALESAGHWALSDNNASLVTTLEYRRRRFLVSGDIELASERWLAPVLSPVDWMTVPHHGSKTSSSSTLLDAARPRVAVVSAGRDSPFGHPDPSILRRYRTRQIPVFQVARLGLVRTRVRPDGRWTVRAHMHRETLYTSGKNR